MPEANELKFDTKLGCDVNSAISTLIARVPVTIQNSVFWMRSVQPQPPARINADPTIIRAPRKIVQFWLWMVALQLTSLGQSPTRPIPWSPGASPMVTNAIPKKAFESSPARVMQNDEIRPT